MKNFTFKLKDYTADENGINQTLISITCPLEALYDSIKLTQDIKNLNAFITQTDYYDQFTHKYITDDVFVGDLKAVFKSTDLRDFLVNNLYKEDDTVEISESV